MYTFDHERAPVPEPATHDPNAKELLSLWMGSDDCVYVSSTAMGMPIEKLGTLLAIAAVHLATECAEDCYCAPLEAMIAMRVLIPQNILHYIAGEAKNH